MKSLSLAAVGLAALLAGAARADTTVEVKNVHLCCKACVTGVEKALKDVAGVTGKCEQGAKTVTLTAKDDAAAQKAIDALAAAGYHGDVSGTKFKVPDDSGATAGKVKSLTITGVHNCCGSCNSSIKKAIAKVSGVSGDTSKPRAEAIEVTGEFDAVELVKSLNAAGFHVKVKK